MFLTPFAILDPFNNFTLNSEMKGDLNYFLNCPGSDKSENRHLFPAHPGLTTTKLSIIYV
jgi:hypothetical protein